MEKAANMIVEAENDASAKQGASRGSGHTRSSAGA